MKKIIFLFLLAFSFSVRAQLDSGYISTNVDIDVYTLDFAGAKQKVFSFINRGGITVLKQSDMKKSFSITFVAYTAQFKAFDSALTSWGFLASKKIVTTNNYDKHVQLELELNYLRQKRDSYLERLKKLDEQSNTYSALWNEEKQIEEHIFQKEKEKLALGKKDNTFTITFDLMDETTSPGNTGVSFVNMPGLEYSYLKLESPKPGVSADVYQGYLLKYLFTKGKSYAHIGAYTNKTIEKKDSVAASELFLLGFGQDFYSRHLGRGERKFFNLYSGYSVGGLLVSSKNGKNSTLYLSPIVGLELFKNKYLLFDSNVKYFVPLNETKNMRGLSYNVSFNFVF